MVPSSLESCYQVGKHYWQDDFLSTMRKAHGCVNVFLAQECVWMSMVEGGAPGKECGVFRKGMTPGGNAGWYKYHFL
jgi:hypothetical protein